MAEFLWDGASTTDESVRAREPASLGPLWMGWMVGELITSAVPAGLTGRLEASQLAFFSISSSWKNGQAEPLNAREILPSIESE